MFSSLSVNKGTTPIAKIRNVKTDDLEADYKKSNKKLKNCLYINFHDTKDDTHPREFKIEGPEELIPLYTCADREGHANRTFLAGGTLCGKSYLAGQILRDYNRQYPKSDVALFSWVEDDKAYDKVQNLNKIRVDESILEDPIELDELADSCCVFDDTAHFGNKDLVKEIDRVQNSSVNAGRHKNIASVVIKQNLLDGAKTKQLLNSCFQIVVYPHSSGRYQAQQYMHRYMCFPKELIDRLLNLPTRFLIINKNPTYVLHSKGCIII